MGVGCNFLMVVCDVEDGVGVCVKESCASYEIASLLIAELQVSSLSEVGGTFPDTLLPDPVVARSDGLLYRCSAFVRHTRVSMEVTLFKVHASAGRKVGFGDHLGIILGNLQGECGRSKKPSLGTIARLCSEASPCLRHCCSNAVAASFRSALCCTAAANLACRRLTEMSSQASTA
ncbi:hypothetical protein L1887_43636 [Cichorium endivia]|nr:hypothetical protein L1887_43636 [Cichorium endivia]